MILPTDSRTGPLSHRVTGAIWGLLLMLKIDLLFRQQSNLTGTAESGSRVAGWSEGWYLNKEIDAARISVAFLCQARAQLLTSAGAIVGQRYRLVDGGSSVENRKFPGLGTTLADIPQMSMLCSIGTAGAPNVRRFAVRGINDASVSEGEFKPSERMVAAFRGYAAVLEAQGFRFKGRVLTNAQYQIESLTADGHLALKTAAAFNPGDKIRLLHCVDDDGMVQSGMVIVRTATDSWHYVVSGYDGILAHRGKVRLDAADYFAVSKATFNTVRVTTHKVGRDFFSYRGRRSTRR